MLGLIRRHGLFGAIRELARSPLAWFVMGHVTAMVSAILFATLPLTECRRPFIEDDLNNIQFRMFFAVLATLLAWPAAPMVVAVWYGVWFLVACIIGTILCCEPFPFCFERRGRNGLRIALWSLMQAPWAPGVVVLAYAAIVPVLAVPALVLTEVITHDCVVDGAVEYGLWTLVGLQGLVIIMWGIAVHLTARHRCLCHGCSLCGLLLKQLRYRFSAEALYAHYEIESEPGWTDEAGDYHHGPDHYFSTPAGGERRAEPDLDNSRIAGRIVAAWAFPLIGAAEELDETPRQPLLPR